MRPISVHAFVAAALAAFLLSGCAISDDKLASMLVAPGKFTLYTCPELAAKADDLAKRRQELEGLMAKAGADASGKLVSTLAYRPDYLTAQGEIKEVRAAAAEKKCDLAGVDVVGAGANGASAGASAATAPSRAATH